MALSMATPFDVAIVGAGIIGTSAAFELSERGRTLCLIDPAEAGLGTAAGSSSFIAGGAIFPVARPSVVRDLPKMLFDPLGPLVIRPAYVPHMLGWGLRFIRSLRPANFRAIVRAQGSLNQRATSSIVDLAKRANAENLFARNGVLYACKDPHVLAHLEDDLPEINAHGIPAQSIDAARVYELEPHLSRDLCGAIFFSQAIHCRDVPAYGRRIVSHIVNRGGTVYQTAATSISPEDGTWSVALSSGERVRAKAVVVSAGVWSKRLLTRLGHVVPIDTERGYHLMLPNPGVTLSRPVVFKDRNFAMTPLAAGLRLAGTVEFAGTSAPMNPRRSDILFELASPILPGLQREGATRWMGFRPTFPDSLPAIGKSSRHANLYYSLGHQHLGLTQSAISARCLADVMDGREAEIDMAPFRLERFA